MIRRMIGRWDILREGLDKEEKMPDHIVTGFDDDLGRLRGHVRDMGLRVRCQYNDAMSCVFSWDEDLYEKVLRSDDEVDRSEERVVDFSTQILMLRQPVSVDLREVISALRIACDLERMGDCAEHMVRRVKELPSGVLEDGGILGDMRDSIYRSMLHAGEQLEGTMSSYERRDAEEAIRAWMLDDKLDEAYALSVKGILRSMKNLPEHVKVLSSMLMLVKDVERVGDHATNIAESVHYMVTGRRLKDALPSWAGKD